MRKNGKNGGVFFRTFSLAFIRVRVLDGESVTISPTVGGLRDMNTKKVKQISTTVQTSEMRVRRS